MKQDKLKVIQITQQEIWQQTRPSIFKDKSKFNRNEKHRSAWKSGSSLLYLYIMRKNFLKVLKKYNCELVSVKYWHPKPDWHNYDVWFTTPTQNGYSKSESRKLAQESEGEPLYEALLERNIELFTTGDVVFQ